MQVLCLVAAVQRTIVFIFIVFSTTESCQQSGCIEALGEYNEKDEEWTKFKIVVSFHRNRNFYSSDKDDNDDCSGNNCGDSQ